MEDCGLAVGAIESAVRAAGGLSDIGRDRRSGSGEEIRMTQAAITAKVPSTNATVSPAYLAHVVFYTHRFTEMTAWYRTVLGADVTMQGERIAFLTFDAEHHRVAIVRRDDLADAPEKTVGFAHAAWTYGSLSDLVATYERLGGEGIHPVWEINHGPTTSIYYADPDGNRTELQVDNFPSVEALNGWFATGAFDRDPIGVEIEFADICRRFHAREPVRDLLRPLSA